MPYVVTFARPVFLVRWTAPRLADVPRVMLEFERAYESFGHPISFIAIVPQDCVPPDDATRKSMSKARDRIIHRCASMHLVMEGEGFRVAILRNALAAMQLFGLNRNRDKVHRTLEEALEGALRLAPVDMKFDMGAVLVRARATGVASPAASGDLRGSSGTH